MNINEYFYFKTIKCTISEDHDMNTCYFYHDTNFDKRRKLVELDNLHETMDIYIYSNNIGFDDEFLNKELLTLQPCLNSFEHKYHILNYKTQNCFFQSSNQLECPYRSKCNNIHDNESPLTQDFFLLREFFARIFEDNYYMNIREVHRLFIEELLLLNISTFDFKENKYLNFDIKTEEYKESNAPVTYHEFLHSFQKNERNHDCLNLGIGINMNDNFTENMNNLNIDSKVPDLKSLVEGNVFDVRNNPHNEILIFQPNSQNIYKDVIDEIRNVPIFYKGHNFINLLDDNCHKAIKTKGYIIYASEKFPVKDEISKLIMSFFNSHNGMLIYGLQKSTEKLVGINMNRKERDSFKQQFNCELVSTYYKII